MKFAALLTNRLRNIYVQLPHVLLVVIIPTILFIVSSIWDIPFLRSIISLYYLFFLPGYLLILAIGIKLTSIEKWCLSIFLSLFVTPYGYFIELQKGISLTPANITRIQPLIVGAILAVYFLSLLLAKTSPKRIDILSEIRNIKPTRDHLSLFTSLGIFCLLTVGLSLLYPYLYEADPYYFLEKARALIATGQHPQIGYRPLFIIFTSLLDLQVKISIWDVTKYLLPLLPTLSIAIFWEFGRQKGLSGWMRVAFSLLLVSSPYYLLESQIVRPQLIIASLAPLFVYFLWKSLQIRSFRLWATIAICAVFSVHYHELGLFLILASATSLVYLVYPHVRTFDKLEWGLSIALGYLLLGRVLGFIHSSLTVSANFFGAFNTITPFRFWFLDNFVNIDGTVVSWKGLDAIYYYAYTLSLTMVALLILGARKKTFAQLRDIFMIPAGTLITVFLLIAEILPRFGINFLPDRAWLFATTILVFPAVYFLKSAQSRTGNSQLVIILLTLFATSVAGSYYVTLQKKGYVTVNENRAADFLANETPKNSIVISQGGNNILVKYFANRTYTGSCLPFKKEQADTELLNSIWKSVYGSEIPELIRKKISEEERRIQSISISPADSVERAEQQARDLITHINTLRKLNQDLQNAPKDSNIYVLYSDDKFNTLYAQREWWRDGNCQKPTFAALANSSYFTLIYDVAGIRIWKVSLPDSMR